MFLIFDTETTGFPKRNDAPLTDLDNWPRVVQLSWQLHDKNGQLIENHDYIIKPEGFDIPFNAQQIHGISTEMALKEGKNLEEVLQLFSTSLNQAEYIVGHNLQFDINALTPEYYRKDLSTSILSKKRLDTQIEGTDICKLGGGQSGRYKYPKLSELYFHLFNEKFKEAHNAAADVNATARAFFEIIRQGYFKDSDLNWKKEDYTDFQAHNPSPIQPFEINIREQSDKPKKEKDSKIDIQKNQTDINTDYFFQYHNHTVYSILSSTSSIKKLIKKAEEYQFPAIGITDFNNLMGSFTFLNEIDKYNAGVKEETKKIKPIIGLEIYISEKYEQKQFTKDNPDKRNPVLLLAKNHDGFKNLSKISTIGNTKGMYSNCARVNKEIILQYKDNLIVTTGGINSEIPYLILNHGEKQAEDAFVWWFEHFKDDFYVQLAGHKLPEEQHVNKVLMQLAKKYGVKILIQNESYYLDNKDADLHDILLCIREGEKKEVPIGRGFGTRFGMPNSEFYIKSTKEMLSEFSYIPEVFDNFEEFYHKFEPYSLKREVLLPKFNIPEAFKNPEDEIDNGTRGENAYLKYLTYEGAKKRYPELTDDIKERLDFELETIEKTGYPGYFLIVQDFTNQARSMGVSVGPGRGSAAGSAVAYCTGITNVDPIKYDLLFERFLNPDRVSLPDIDIDFDDRGREKIINWVVEKYGQSQVAQIITYGKLAGRSAIRDTSRVLELPLFEADRLAKKLPSTLSLNDIKNKSKEDLSKMLREDIIGGVIEIKELENQDNETARVIRQATELEGMLRSTGVHACGVIITPTDITDLVPVTTSKDSELFVSQFDNSVVESAGLLKMDFLGLRNLTIINDAILLIKNRHGIDIDPDQIPLDDEHTYNEIFKKGNTAGIFQYESPGMQKHLKALEPDKFDDLIAMNALYRPGPLKYIPNFINRKHGKEAIEYDLPDMEEYLKDTYGITVYQEQVMLLSQKLAGFTKGEADNLRKAMGKKQIEIMNKLYDKFIQGGIANNHPENILKKIWKDWEAFAEYAFNKSHSTCYAVVAFQTAYLKAHYPSEFMAALLSNNLNQMTTVTQYLDETNKMGLEVLGPDINESEYFFTVNEKGKIRFGMGAIKGMGLHTVEAIMDERKNNGAFEGIFDLLERIEPRHINKKTIESLAYAGAFDEFDTYHRAQYFVEDNEGTVIEKLTKYAVAAQETKNSAQQSLFGDSSEGFEVMKPKLPEVEEWNLMKKLAKEKEMTGFYVTSHPLDEFKYEMKVLKPIPLEELENDIDKFKGREIYVAGMITSAEHRFTKDQRKKFGILTLEDYSGKYTFNLYNDEYLNNQAFLMKDVFVCIKLAFRPNYDNTRLFTNILKIQYLDNILNDFSSKIQVQLNINELNDTILAKLDQLLTTYPGNKKFIMDITDMETGHHLSMPSQTKKINICKEVLDELNALEGLRFVYN